MIKITDYEKFDREYAYDGDDLGVTFRDGKTVFKTWSPLATGVYLNLYLDGEGDNRIETVPLERLERGCGMSSFCVRWTGCFTPTHMNSIISTA